MNYTDINARTIDRWVDEGWEWGAACTHEEFERARSGDVRVLLTPGKLVPGEWLGELRGKRLFGLACGGGQQMPLFTAAGAICTVLDYSERQLESERRVAAREGYDIEIIRADMTRPLPFDDETFDIIFSPVSFCYVHEVKPIFRECFRILKKGGVLLCGMDSGLSFLFGEDETTLVNTLPFDPLANPEQMAQLRESNDGVQFSHTLEEQIGGQLEAGFILTGIYDDTNTTGPLHDHNVPCFYATRALKPAQP